MKPRVIVGLIIMAVMLLGVNIFYHGKVAGCFIDISWPVVWLCIFVVGGTVFAIAAGIFKKEDR